MQILFSMKDYLCLKAKEIWIKKFYEKNLTDVTVQTGKFTMFPHAQRAVLRKNRAYLARRASRDIV